MKLTIQGTELVVTIKSATGDYRALFVSENEESENEKCEESPVVVEPYAEVEKSPVMKFTMSEDEYAEMFKEEEQ